MNHAILTNFYFTICIFSAILLVEISINFKKPFSLKILMLMLVGSILVHNLTLFLDWGLFLNALSRFMIAIISINLLYLLYKHRFNKKMLFLSILLLIITIINISIPVEALAENSPLARLRFFNKIIVSGGLLYLSIYVYKKLVYSLSINNLYSKKIKQWTKITVVMFSIGIINNFMNSFFPSYLLLSRWTAVGIQMTTCILLMYRPSFLNRTELSISLGKLFRRVNLEQVNEEKFVHEFYTKQYYLNKDTYIDEFAKGLNISTVVLNEFIQETTKMSFIDLVNKKRIDHFITLVANKEYEPYSIEGLSEIAGFGTRNSFYRNFKKFHGGSPSDLIRMHE